MGSPLGQTDVTGRRTPEDRGTRLVVLSPSELAGRLLLLGRAENVIGHDDGADLVLDERLVSHRHAVITVYSAGRATMKVQK